MKTILHRLLLPGLAAAMLLSSCNDFLNVRPKGIVIPETCEDYEKLLNDGQILKASDSYPNYMTDDVYLTYDGLLAAYMNLDLPYQRLYTFDSEVFGDGENDDLWEYTYNRLYTYNVIIDDVMSSTEATEEHKRQVRTEALMMRAFEYLILVNAYANHYDPATAATDPGVPLMLDKVIDKTDLRRASVQEVYDQIMADLDEAAPNLPDKPVLNAFRASKPVDYGMLARMYLYMGNYEKALENARISLEHNSTLLDLKPHTVNPALFIGRLSVPQLAENPENIFIRLAPYTFGLSTKVNGSDDLLSLFDKEKDKRFLLYFARKISSLEFERDVWIPYLYANMAMSTPEIYLIAAECEARIGSKDKAMEYINTLRDNRIIDNVHLTATSNDDALVKVLEEHRRELAMIGCTRLIDLKRLNRDPRFAKTITHEVNGQTYTLKPNDPKYILPIPLDVIRHNPNMIQNKR